MVITKQQLIRKIFKTGDFDVLENERSTVGKVFDAMEDIIFDALSSTTQEEDTTIKLFEGLSLECKYIPEKEILHPKTNEKMITPAKIWSKAKITRYYNRKLNEVFNR